MVWPTHSCGHFTAMGDGPDKVTDDQHDDSPKEMDLPSGND